MSNPANIPALLRTACPVVKIENGQAVTLSTEVARVFSKRHDDVLKAIRNLLPDLTADHVRNFAETVITRENPSGGAGIDSKAYHLTRDGFTLLAMGFTGKKALAFKLAYIEAFNQMEAALHGQPLPAPVPTRTLTFSIPLNEHSARWLLDIDRQGNERTQRLDSKTHVLTRERLVRMLIQNPADLSLTLEERLSILAALLRGLGQSASLFARQLNLKPANAPEIPAGQIASIGG